MAYSIGRSINIFTKPDTSKLSDSLLWGPYHVNLSTTAATSVSTVAYNPIIMAPPSDYATIYTAMRRNKEIANALGHTSLPIFFDMGLLPKALKISWAHPDELSGVIPCEGGMHLLMSYMSGISYLYGDAGITNLLIDMFDGSYTDPFNLDDPPACLINFATGVMATQEVQDSLLGALKCGAESAKKFLNERLAAGVDKSFYATLSRSGIKTMGSLTKPVKMNPSKEISMQPDIT